MIFGQLIVLFVDFYPFTSGCSRMLWICCRIFLTFCWFFIMLWFDSSRVLSIFVRFGWIWVDRFPLWSIVCRFLFVLTDCCVVLIIFSCFFRPFNFGRTRCRFHLSLNWVTFSRLFVEIFLRQTHIFLGFGCFRNILSHWLRFAAWWINGILIRKKIAKISQNRQKCRQKPFLWKNHVFPGSVYLWVSLYRWSLFVW